MIRLLRIRILLLAASVLIVSSASISLASEAGMKPSTVSQDKLQSGLSVLYIRSFRHRHLDKLPTGKWLKERGRPGKPIPYLNHSFGKGIVFDSGVRSLIGLHMTGYIHLVESGEYQFKAFVNDGIRVFISEQLIVDEPKWDPDGDRYTEIGKASISETGWYPILIRYFQRKGTATVKLDWKEPGDKDFSVIPEAAYAHEPS